MRYDGILNEYAEQAFAEGVRIDGDELCLPAGLERLGPGEAIVTVHEGRYHQVKRMISAVGGEVTYLKRLSIGPVELDERLLPGGYRELSDKEFQILADISGLCQERR